MSWVWSSLSRAVAGVIYMINMMSNSSWYDCALIWWHIWKCLFCCLCYSFTCNSSSTLVSGDPGCCLTINLTNKKNNLQQKRRDRILEKINYKSIDEEDCNTRGLLQVFYYSQYLFLPRREYFKLTTVKVIFLIVLKFTRCMVLCCNIDWTDGRIEAVVRELGLLEPPLNGVNVEFVDP